MTEVERIPVEQMPMVNWFIFHVNMQQQGLLPLPAPKVLES